MLLVIIVTFVFSTFSRYASESNGDAQVQIAKWQIEVNDELLDNTMTSLSATAPLYNLADGTTSIDAGETCYTDIEIDPTDTEVAVEYSISFDLADISPITNSPCEALISFIENIFLSIEPLSFNLFNIQ